MQFVKPTTIFLDLDDVLNRFSMYALQSVGCCVDVYDESDWRPEWGFDIVKAANELHATVEKFAPNDFWDRIQKHVWAETPKSSEYEDLLKLCNRLAQYSHTCILSAPTHDPECAAGKMDWITWNLPKELQRNFLIGPHKNFCARPDALLIDDSDANVRAFRAWGGQAYLFPRPWNTSHGRKPDYAAIEAYWQTGNPEYLKVLR
jgi:5'(3')-deoxyribonucleotidase